MAVKPLHFSHLSFSFNLDYCKELRAVSKKNIIKFHFENVKTKCFGISEVKHFIKKDASECFDIFLNLLSSFSHFFQPKFVNIFTPSKT